MGVSLVGRSVRLPIVAGIVASLCGAQGVGGVFRGQARDESRAALTETRIAIESLDSGVRAYTETSSDGIYVTPPLIAGTYRLTATKDGFQPLSIGPILLQINETLRVDFDLHVGTVSSSIEVAAGAEHLLASESADIAQVISSQQVAGMPLNGRRWQQLIALSAGVTTGAPGETGAPNPVNINGQRNKANLFLADGISTTSSSQGRGNGFNIPLEAVREFSVQAGSYSAEYGNVGGGVINLQTKSGTNDWHGSAFEYLRNDALDASHFFSNATGQAKNALRYNQFGGAIGGPVLRNRTFVFADYQGTLQRSGLPLIATVRPNEQRGGDFSALRNAAGATIPIYDPRTVGAGRAQFAGNVIPTNRIDAAAAKLSALLPQPNQFDSAGQPLAFNNFAATRTTRSDNHSFDVRVDHRFSDKSSIFVRHSYQDSDATIPSVFGLPLGGPPTGAGETRARLQNAGIGHFYQLRPAWINEFRVGLNRITSNLQQEDYGLALADQFGIPGVNRDAATSGLPNINVAGVFGLGGSILTPLRLAATAWTVSEKMTWVAGIHTLRWGVDLQYEMGSSGYLVFGRGSYTFSPVTTSIQVPQGFVFGDSYASFLTGVPLTVTRDTFPAGLVGLITPRAGFYVQDDVKLLRNLTMNVGARYDVMPYAREKHNRLSNFDPVTRTMRIAGQDAPERLRETDYSNWAPRIGIAYTPGFDTVLRAGYGIGYIDPLGSASVLNGTQFNIPFYYRDNILQFPTLLPQYSLSGALPGLAAPSPSNPSGDQRYLVPNDRNQYSQTWSLSVQHGFTPSLLAEVAYVGTSGSRLLMTSNINAATPGGTNPSQRRPFGAALAEVRAFSNSAHSTYHGMQAKIEQRFSRGMYLLASYTWSKSMDNQSTGTDDSAAGGQSPQNPLNHSLDRGPSSFDRTHRFVASAVWELPAPRFAARLTGGWQASAIFEAQTGAPFSVVLPCAMIGAEGNNCRPDRIADGRLTGDQRSIQRWFDTAAFRIPAPPAYGSAGRNILRGPGNVNVDLMVAKSFPWGGRDAQRVQVRGEFFNAFNHTNFGLPVRTMDSLALGTITSAAAARVVQLAARVEF